MRRTLVLAFSLASALVVALQAQLPTTATGQSIVRENTAWGKEPDSFHGVKFGATEAEVQANLQPWICVKSEEFGLCYFHVEVAGRPHDGIASLVGGKLSEVFCLFDENDFSAVRDVLVLAYGDPSQHDEDRGMRWIGSRVSAVLDHSSPPELKSKVDQIALARFKFELDIFLNTHKRVLDVGLDLFRRTHDRRDYERIAEDASSTFESNKASAVKDRDQFIAGRYGSFSIALNSYVAETAKRNAEQKKKDAAAIR